MTADKQRWLVGGALVIVVAIAVWMQMRPAATTVTAGPAAGARPSPARDRAAAAAAASQGPMTLVQLAALEADRAGPSDTARNPFRFKPKAAPAPPKSVAPPRPEALAPPSPGTPGAGGPPPGPPPPPPIALKFIGLVEKSNGFKVAVLTDGRTTLYGREGDIIDGRYRIVKIGVESIELTYADGRGRQTVRLTGQ